MLLPQQVQKLRAAIAREGRRQYSADAPLLDSLGVTARQRAELSTLQDAMSSALERGSAGGARQHSPPLHGNRPTCSAKRSRRGIEWPSARLGALRRQPAVARR